MLARQLSEGIHATAGMTTTLDDAQAHAAAYSGAAAADNSARVDYHGIMNEREAQELLKDIELVQVAVASMQDIKRMHRSCLQADIPAVMDCPSGKGG